MKTILKKAVVLLTVLAMLVSMVPGMSAIAADPNSPVVKVVPRALNEDGSYGDVIDPSTLEVGDAFVAAVEVHEIPEGSYFKSVQIALSWDINKVTMADADGEEIVPSSNATVNSTAKKALINVSEELLFNEDEETGWLSTLISYDTSTKGSVPAAIDYSAVISDSIVYFEDALYTDIMYPLEGTSVFVYGIRLVVKELGDTRLGVCKSGVTTYSFDVMYPIAHGAVENAIINLPDTAEGQNEFIYNQVAVERTDIIAGPAPTEAPTAVPTEVPTEEPTAVPTEVPVTEVPVDYTGKVPVAGSAIFANMYTNNNVTGTNGAASGDYVLDANNGDASLYLWADAQVGALNEGKEVMLSFTIDVPATNAVSSEEHGVQIAYMNRAQTGYAIYTFAKGATYDVQLALLPNGDYILVVDDVQVASGTLECSFADLWNICWRTYWAGNTNTGATVSNVASAEIAEWVTPSVVTEAPVTEAPVTEAPVTEAPVTEAPVTEAPGTEAPVDRTGKVPVAGTAFDPWMYENANASTVSGGYKIDASINGDASLYGWSDPFMSVLNDGKEAMISFTIDVPATNAVDEGDHGVQIGYMDRAQAGYEIYTFRKGATYDVQLALIPNGDYIDYILVVDDVQVATGTMECTKDQWWNICWRTYWAGNTNTQATITDIIAAEIAEWVYPEGVTAPPVTEAPVTEAPVTEAPVTEAPVTEAPVTEAPVTEAPATEAPATEAPATEAPATEAPVGELSVSDTTVNLKVGKSTTVNAYVGQTDVTDTATWRSAKATVATVNNGVITAVKSGTTTVTVEYEGQVKQITVKVTSSSTGGYGGGGGITDPVPTEAPVAGKMFIDIDNVPWAVDAIEALAEAGIVNGVGNQMFDPNGLVTREQFAKMLIEALDFNYSGAVCDFYDVVTGSWYYRYVAEAYRQGIMKGINEENMGIGMNITRQDLCTMIYRALQAKGVELPVVEAKATFKDDASIADYARDAVSALQMAGIIDGMGDGTFAPNATATRAQAAKIIYGVYSLLK